MRQHYKIKINNLELEIINRQKESTRYSWYRSAAAMAFFFALWIATLSPTLGIIIAGVSFGIFIILACRHSKLERKIIRLKQFLTIYQNELSIKDSNLFGNGNEYIDDSHNYASDLDLFGKQSLFAYINRTVTKEGKDMLASFLLKRGSKKEIVERQELAAELSKKEKFKEEFLQTYFLSQTSIEDNNGKTSTSKESQRIHQFVASFVPNFQSKRWLLFLSYLLPICLFATLLLLAVDSRWGIGTIILFCANCLLMSAFNLRIAKIHSYIGKHGSLFEKYAKLMQLIRKESFTHTELKNVQNRLIVEHQFDKKLQRIAWLTKMLDVRDSNIIWFILNTLFLWDFHCVYAIEKWFIKNRTELHPCLEEVGKMDAYLSLGIFYFNHPSFNFPTLLADYFTMEAVDMGHPLIPELVRVNNDFSIQQNQKVGIVTGSNMSGKSTFLRTLGINMVLAYAGLPVCARSFAVSLSDIQTYMRTRDSLSENTSSFRAELMRLKKIIDEINQNSHCFLLLDELLKGTNSTDKYLGSVAIVKYLLTHHTVGLVATHDLALTEMEKEYANSIRNYHFDITVAGEELYFDYKLCKGACKTFNAKLLLKKIGIVIE